MEIEELVSNYPILYHMASEGSWEGIREYGLLSTSSLLDLFQIEGDERTALEDRHRPETVTISNDHLGSAKIRDQKPMSDGGLERALRDGLTPRDWYRTLNSKVFFWTNTERLRKLLCAKAYREFSHDVLWVNTDSVVQEYSQLVRLCPMNSGATKPYPHPRGVDTFLSIADYPWGGWVQKRGIQEAIVEIAFESGIPHISNHVRRVVRMRENQELQVLFEHSR